MGSPIKGFDQDKKFPDTGFLSDGNRLPAISHQQSGTVLAGFEYGYDAEGNKLYEAQDHHPDTSEAYSYDNINRLVDHRIGTLISGGIPIPVTDKGWQLDGVGNWLSTTNTLFGNAPVVETRDHNAVNEVTGIVVSNQSSVVSSDDNGNLTNDGNLTYQYDEGNRLQQVASSQQPVASYAYDALGRRISKTVNGTTTYFFYDGARIVEEQSSGGSGSVTTYVYGNYVDEVLQRLSPNSQLPSPIFYSQNALFSVVLLTDGNGLPVERYTYDAYGAPSILDANYQLLTTSATGNRILFTGREYDAETCPSSGGAGLYHYRARAYSPLLGRFMQRDPIGYVDGMNLYGYVNCRPLGLTDPLGLAKCEVQILVGHDADIWDEAELLTDEAGPCVGIGAYTCRAKGIIATSNKNRIKQGKVPIKWINTKPTKGLVTSILGEGRSEIDENTQTSGEMIAQMNDDATAAAKQICAGDCHCKKVIIKWMDVGSVGYLGKRSRKPYTGVRAPREYQCPDR